MDLVSRAGRLYVIDLHHQLVGVDLAEHLARDPALHLDVLRDLGRHLQRRADDVAHCWTAITLHAELWVAKGMGPPEEFEPSLALETSDSFRSVRWLAERSSDAQGWWRRLEDALHGPELHEGMPDGRADLVYCRSCDEVKNPAGFGVRFCLVCENSRDALYLG